MMDDVESEELKRATRWAMRNFDRDHVFTADDICTLHRIWLESNYVWAGQYRQVIMSKGDFTFAFPAQIPRFMAELENKLLSRHTPCRAGALAALAEVLAVVHVELLLIHPFREGNGRIARLLAVLMALQAGMPYLDFSKIKGNKKNEYFAAIRACIYRNYDPMSEIFNGLLSFALKVAEQRKDS
ncbi:MAG: cell filamentation protein Fic [Deltaproteobacteria bacterium CG23_combo_of_CG06-09_8_20_14_all_51_20]|nr:Fic family protein [bacterium]PIP45054.1 MAG: cell filamentation protein Fic [Deltaproteobacteria bacterium CG23_combo_of_CG06-09_8_20_14_all_51_20]PJB37208.1 MAG: cell filamentation protein Fic [Deltaproteobacteria bacterium CG_4_9_14_3_um_filter_51_14]